MRLSLIAAWVVTVFITVAALSGVAHSVTHPAPSFIVKQGVLK